MLARLVAIAFGLGACGAAGAPLTDWTLDARDGPHDQPITLPGSLTEYLSFREVDYTLTTEVTLAPDQRSTALTLTIDGVYGTLGVVTDGVRLDDIGDTDVGEHRFVIAPAVRSTLSIAIFAHQDINSISGFGVSPRLSIGVAGRTTAATINRNFAVVEIGVSGAFVLMFGVLYALDRRRRENAAFAIAELVAVIAPLWQLGVIGDAFGAATHTILGISVCVLYLSVIYFVHFALELARPARGIVLPIAMIGVAHLADPVSMKIAAATSAATMLGMFGALGYAMASCVRAARQDARRQDAHLLLAAMAVSTPLLLTDLPWVFFGRSLFAGVHVGSFALFALTLAGALLLVRQHVARQRALERVAGELRHQVSERSRELGDALAKLAKQPAVDLEQDRIIDGRYRVLRKLGAGGMGAVFEVERTSDHQRLALKTLRGKVDTEAMARFAREAQIAAEIHHPNLVPVLDVGITDGGLFLVMPLVAGGSLEHARARFGDHAWAAPLLAPIADGLAAMHGRGIIHRDLKPANILLAKDGPQIADFGLAYLQSDAFAQTAASGSVDDGAFANTAAPQAELTRVGDIFGTPNYMAPELASGSLDAGAATDVFSFGVIAYELCAGRRPFETPAIRARLAGKPPGTPDMTAVDGSVREILARCLDLDPDRRPTAAELVVALR